jgi:hypothetical protein
VITYVESNFVLELAFRQEDSASCEELLALAESRQIELLIPAYCLGEPFVYASVHSRVAHQQPSPQCFINKNSRDFLVPEIVEDFEARNCKLIGKFSDGLNYVESTLNPDVEPGA